MNPSYLLDWLRQPWPWYIAGPLIGLLVPALLVVGNRAFGISSNLRHLCAVLPSRVEFFRYDWRGTGLWNLTFAAGIVLGAAVAAYGLSTGGPIALDPDFRAELAASGIHQGPSHGSAGVLGATADLNAATTLVPTELFRWQALATPAGFATLVVGTFLVGFGARWAGGCTSGHAITGLADLQLPSLVAVLGFFAGGLVASRLLVPWLLGLTALGAGATP